MSVLNLSRSQLALACVSVGSCATGVPVALHYAQGDLTEQTANVNESNTHLSTNLDMSQPDINKEREEGFETLWNKISSGYSQKQTLSENQMDNNLSFKSELKEILVNKSNSGGAWLIEEEEYKDCSQISGGKTDYCGYLKLKVGSDEYRLKFDRYGRGGNSKKWDVTVVKKIGDNSVQWYSSRKNNWETKDTGINNFQGYSQSSLNWWIKLVDKSITIQ